MIDEKSKLNKSKKHKKYKINEDNGIENEKPAKSKKGNNNHSTRTKHMETKELVILNEDS